jgi:tRNA A37 methylthiotransferase MiaB
MRSLLLSGLGITYKNSSYFNNSLLSGMIDERTQAVLSRSNYPDLQLSQFSFEDRGRRHPLLRPPDSTPHLTTFTLESILQASGNDYVHIPLEDVWNGSAAAPPVDVQVVLLSTTYIWNRPMMTKIIEWLRQHLPGVPVVAGGQYTNLKFTNVLAAYPEISSVVRGDAEAALPILLDTLRTGGDLSRVPNLVWRDGSQMRINPFEYVDIEEHPSPSFPDQRRIVPYESMRGCPFDCKFCSFPAASPKWRYKSAEKIRDDWTRYATENNASFIEAMDSTFTVPPTRLRRLVEILPSADIPKWSCFSRANVVSSQEFIDGLLESNCHHLEIGFESMSDATLQRMRKRVTAKQNRRAFELLNGSELGFGTCFIVGYPGEDTEDFEVTRRFIVEEHSGRFSLHLFSISDETMPLWEDRDELQITVEDPLDPDSGWSHIGMTKEEALKLQADTLDEVRRRNETAVASLWQREYQRPLLPVADRLANLAVEKAIERLSMCSRDYPSIDEAAAAVQVQLDRLRELGVTRTPCAT